MNHCEWDNNKHKSDVHKSQYIKLLVHHMPHFMVPDRNCADQTTNHEAIEPKQPTDKEPIIVQADTVVDPWAVVIHAKHAIVADAAVVRPGRLDIVAVEALSKPDFS
jgi:hypothetical protein